MQNLEGLLAAGLTPYWHFSGVFHPAVAHFPIALLVVAALVESWSVVRGQRKPIATTLVCLYIGAVAAVVATVLGWASADASGDKGATLDLHRWLGVAVAVLAVVSVILSTVLRRRDKAGKRLIWSYRAGVFVSAALVGLVGSYGGKLVHGETYYDDALAALQHDLEKAAADVAKTAVVEGAKAAMVTANAVEVTEPPAQPTTALEATPAAAAVATAPAAAQPAAPDLARPEIASAANFGGGQIDYARDIEPIFLANCVKCHNETKKKGGYRLDARERVFAAGQSGTVPVLPGKSDESLLVKMIEGKGEFADSIMPPKGNPLTYQQIALIRRWIDEGAQTSSAYP